MSRTRLAVGSVTVLGALLRFPTLDAKSFWEDEAVTVFLVRRGFGSMLDAIPGSEATPPVYYVLAWVWTHVFGSGEVGIRSLSALIGTATVPVAYLAGRELVSRRVGITSAALVAVNPLLVWYSQEARAYALLVLLGGLSFLCFVRALREPGAHRLAAWAVVSSLALATHYFALFLVAAEAAWLLHRVRPRRAAVLALAPVVAVGAALLLLAEHQLESPGWIDEISLASRVVQIPGFFLIGFEAPIPFVLVAVAALLALAGLWSLVARADVLERRAALLAGAVGAAAVLAPLVLSLAGVDFLIFRNVIGALFPLAVAVAVGFAGSCAGRIGPAAAAVLCALSVGVVLATSWEPKYHREDWRGAAEALGAPDGTRVIVLTPEAGGEPLELYLGAVPMPAGEVAVREIDLIGGARRDLGSLAAPRTPRPATPPPPAPGFTAVERVEGEKFTLIRYRSDQPVRVTAELLAASVLDAVAPVVLVQPAGSRY